MLLAKDRYHGFSAGTDTSVVSRPKSNRIGCVGMGAFSPSNLPPIPSPHIPTGDLAVACDCGRGIKYFSKAEVRSGARWQCRSCPT